MLKEGSAKRGFLFFALLITDHYTCLYLGVSFLTLGVCR